MIVNTKHVQVGYQFSAKEDVLGAAMTISGRVVSQILVLNKLNSDYW